MVSSCKITADSKPEFSDLVGEVKKAISRIDAEFFKQIKGDEGKSVMSEFFKTHLT